MDKYNIAAQKSAVEVTKTFSTSFGLASKFFDKSIRQDIYNIYGLVRLGDEIVDSYMGKQAEEYLTKLEQEVYDALKSGYSTNLIVHAFAISAIKFGIDDSRIKPFFDSMRMDLTLKKHTQQSYEDYIYGSAEVIGLMCLRVFVDGKDVEYEKLKNGAQALGAAFQKVNFLRDLAADHKDLDRFYFPGTTFEAFDDVQKNIVVADIEANFTEANRAAASLPNNSKLPVRIAYVYFSELLSILKSKNANEIKAHRFRVSDSRKIYLIAKTAALVKLGYKWGSKK